MDRGPWWATVHGVAKESDMTSQLKTKQKHLMRSYCMPETVLSILHVLTHLIPLIILCDRGCDTHFTGGESKGEISQVIWLKLHVKQVAGSRIELRRTVGYNPHHCTAFVNLIKQSTLLRLLSSSSQLELQVFPIVFQIFPHQDIPHLSFIKISTLIQGVCHWYLTWKDKS